MHVVLDRNLCSNAGSGCEVCFATHLACGDFESANCAVSIVDTQRPEYVLRVQDRDQSIKTLVVKEENMNEALASWLWLWERQSGPVI